MTTATDPPLYKRHGYSIEIISHAVWLYCRFTLSYWGVEELLAAHGIKSATKLFVSGVLSSGQLYAHQLRRRRPQTGDKWHLAGIRQSVVQILNGNTPIMDLGKVPL